MSYTYAYFIGNAILLLIWLVLYSHRKDLRRQQLSCSLLTAPFAPITQVLWFYNDYWRPEYIFPIQIVGVPVGFEEIMFAFLIGGIGSVMYEVLLHKKYRAGHPRTRLTWGIIAGGGIIFLLLKFVDVNTVWASSIALVICSLVMLWVDRYLERDWLLTTLFMFVLVIGMYSILLTLYPELVSKFWVQTSLSGQSVLRIPIEEIAWFISWAMFSGIVYEFWVNAKKYSEYSLIPARKNRRSFS